MECHKATAALDRGVVSSQMFSMVVLVILYFESKNVAVNIEEIKKTQLKKY